MRVIAAVLVALALAAALVALADGSTATALMHWGAERQREVQNAMAAAIRAAQAGESGAVLTLCLLGGAYGFVHALGPGHGKVLLGGAALAGGVGTGRMLAVGVLASLAQAGTAILLVAVGVRLFALTSAEVFDLAEGRLATASLWAMTALAALVVWRGGRALWRTRSAAGPVLAQDHAHSHDHGHDHCHDHGGAHRIDNACRPACGHAHGPTAAEVAALSSPRDLAMLVGSVALRPCTGALFLLVIAWRFGIPGAGSAAVLAMGLGTALFNSLAVGGGVAARRMLSAGGDVLSLGGQRVAAALQIAAGLGMLALTLGFRL